VGAVSPVGLLSGAGSLSMGLSTGFHLLGHFRGLILLVWVIYPGCWVVAVVLWAFSWAVSHNPRVAFVRGD